MRAPEGEGFRGPGLIVGGVPGTTGMMLSLLAPSVLVLSLGVGPGSPEVPVQSPAMEPVSPAETAPPEDEGTPADGEESVPEPETAIAEEPSETEPAPPDVSPAEAPPAPELPPASNPELDRDWVTIRAPRWRGTGLLIASGVSLAAGVAFQAGDMLLCGDCASGVLERAFMAASMGLAAGGGVVRGHADAYDDAALRRSRRNIRGPLVAGAVLTGAGAALGLVNEGMWWGCVYGNDGPYFTGPQDDFFSSYPCRYGAMRGLLDVATATTGTGLALLTWSLTYRRDARAYSRARVIGLRPTLGRTRFGLTVEGRF